MCAVFQYMYEIYGKNCSLAFDTVVNNFRERLMGEINVMRTPQ